MSNPYETAPSAAIEAPRAPVVPEKPSPDGLEEKWSAQWEESGCYRFDRRAPRERVFSIDTPPPTVSGSLHMGSVFGYVQTDSIARFRRMQGWELFYPMGSDDNGLPTERRVQDYFGVRCDPALPYDPGFRPPKEPADPPLRVSRPNFIELCARLTAEDEEAFEEVWRRIGLSVDWTQTYETIGERARRVSQRMFLHNLARAEAYHTEAPTLWDVDQQTAVAQAELEEREVPGAFHRLRFDDLEIETTRPELLPACVALVAHPDDPRYRDRFGISVRTPLFQTEVTVLAHHLADPQKGTGIAMVCTFGDLTDVVWWRELHLPIRSVVTHDGRISSDPPAGVENFSVWKELAGKPITAARARIVQLLKESGSLVGDPRPVKHPVKFYERGERPLEIVTSRQWYIRNGGRDETLREAMRRRGNQLEWHPTFMHSRYEDWVEGLNSDWLVSRQRFFGVPFPLWYPLDGLGEPDFDHPLLANESSLPVDPATQAPDGYEEAQRGRPNGFMGDPDVMDTWATSSLTPHIAGAWCEEGSDLFERVFPMDLRPQGPEIIRTWLFATVLRSHLEHEELPWSSAAINGWVLDPDRKKMSKSKGNVVTPMDLLENHGSDAVRYWAASGRPGVDTAFDEKQMKIGRRLAIKVLNASRFVLSRLGDEVPPAESICAPIDLAMLCSLARVVDEATAAFERYDYARALERTEGFFWAFCDDYLELVKARSYEATERPEPASARAALGLGLSIQLRLFAPFLPFVTEEVWSWWHAGSIHRAPWPSTGELPAGIGIESTAPGSADESTVLAVASRVLGEIRRAKTTAKRSMRARVSRVKVVDDPSQLSLLEQAYDDLRQAGNVDEIVARPGPTQVLVELAEEESP